MWERHLFGVDVYLTFFNRRGEGQTRSVWGGGGKVFENSLDSSIYVVCYVNVLHVLNDFNL